MPVRNMPLKCYMKAICPNYLMCMNGGCMPINMQYKNSLASTMWQGVLSPDDTIDDNDWTTTMPTKMTTTPQPNCIDWVGHLAKSAWNQSNCHDVINITLVINSEKRPKRNEKNGFLKFVFTYFACYVGWFLRSTWTCWNIYFIITV